MDNVSRKRLPEQRGLTHEHGEGCMNDFYINKTPTGYTVTVDGKLRGSRLTEKEATHIGKMLTDDNYRRTYERIQHDPEQAVKDIQEFRRRHSPVYYARMAKQAQYYLRGHAMPKKGVGLEESPMTWEGAEVRWGDAWKSELYRYIAGLQRELKKVEDTEALSLLRKMARALTLEDRVTYYESLDELMSWYGEMW